MNSKLSFLLVSGGVLALAGAAVLPRAGASAAATSSALPVVTVTARDFAFDAPDTVRAGLTAIRLVNKGPELHHIQLVRLNEGKTMADVQAALQHEGPPPAWAVMVGGPNAPAPGGEAEAILTLEPGRYALMCWIPSKDGQPHVMKGMVREMIVVPAKGAKATPPAADVTLELDDYAFGFSKPLTAGRHVIHIENAASQGHEMFMVKLAPGKAPQDLLAWMEKQDGPPPAMPVGGVTFMAPGTTNDIVVNLEPGEYGLFCFVPDAKDGKPHIAHGMIQQISVK